MHLEVRIIVVEVERVEGLDPPSLLFGAGGHDRRVHDRRRLRENVIAEWRISEPIANTAVAIEFGQRVRRKGEREATQWLARRNGGKVGK